MQIHTHKNIQNNFLEQKIVFNDSRRLNYPQECRDAAPSFNKALNDSLQQAEKNKYSKQIHHHLTEAQHKVQQCQNALRRASFDKKTEQQGLIDGQEFEVFFGALLKGAMHITKVIADSIPGRYIIHATQNGVKKIISVTKSQYQKVYNIISKQPSKTQSIQKTQHSSSMQSSYSDFNSYNPHQAHLQPNPIEYRNHAGRTSTVTYRGDSKPLGHGGYGTVSKGRVEVQGPNGRSRNVTMATKRMHSPAELNSQLEIHESLQKANIPTFTTLRVNLENNSILTTNLNKNGTFAIAPNNGLPPGFTPSEYSISKKTLDALISDISATIDNAIKKNIKLAPDSIFFLVNKKSSRIGHVIGDLDMVKVSDINKISQPIDIHLEKLDIIKANMSLYDSINFFLTKTSSFSPQRTNYIQSIKNTHHDKWLTAIQ